MGKRKISLLIALMMIFSTMVPTFAFGSTSNDYDNHWAKDSIQEWLNKGYISGYENGEVRPEEKVTRAQFIKMINNVFGYTAKAEISFTDVKSGSWYYEEVQKAISAGYITGTSATTFEPESFITREQAAVIIARLKKLQLNVEYAKNFKDYQKISSWALGEVGAAAFSGYITGYEDATFGPQEPLKRAESIVTIDRAKKGAGTAIGGGTSGGSSGGNKKPSGGGGDVTEPEKQAKVFSDSLDTISKQGYSKEKFTAKPLIILMDFPDYKYTDLDTKEDWRINSFKGSETTPEMYEDLFFGDDYYTTSDGEQHITVNKFFKEESGGTYEFKGDVYGWYTTKKEARYYGKGKTDQERSVELVQEGIAELLKDQPNIDLSQYDVEDKWDIDNDGNYDEPDGIIDTIVLIHAGLGEEWGGGSLGEDAIWPFRIGFSWYEDYELDLDNPLEAKKLKEVDENGNSLAYRFEDTKGKEWFAQDFTVFEQDLPVDLFDHEYGHVLGLPDFYSSATPPVENWSIMGGSYTGSPRGSEPVGYGAWCRKYLQEDFEKRGRVSKWQNSEVLDIEKMTQKGIDIVLDQASLKGENKDAVIIDLPDHREVVVPPNGDYLYFSGRGDNLKNFMTVKEPIDLTNAENPKLTFETNYDIDPGFDFASVQVRIAVTSDNLINAETEDGWVAIRDTGNLTTNNVDEWVIENETPEQVKDRNPGWGITKSSWEEWVDAEFDLSEYAGEKIELRFRFRTDGNTPGAGIYFDDIKIADGEKAIFEDGGEEQESKFELNDFKRSDGADDPYDHYYILEWRNSGAGTLVDKGLSTINIGRPTLEYDPGLLVWHINAKYDGKRKDQDTYSHPGRLFAGIVDADQNPVMYNYKDRPSTGADNVNYQMHDAAFGLKPGSELRIDQPTYTVIDENTFMNPNFSDSADYRSKTAGEWMGLRLVNYGLKVFVTDESKDRSTASIHIARQKDGRTDYTEQSQDLVKEIIQEKDRVSVIATGQYGSKVYAEYVNDDNAKKQIVLKYRDGQYSADAEFLSKNKTWKLSHLVFIDDNDNAKAIYNLSVHKIFGADLDEITTIVK